mgnify:CR=1 FL=1|jgi:hypothetical protein
MTLQEAVTLLENHNKWRRGDDTLEMAEPKDLGMAIELIVEHFNTKEKEMKEVRETSKSFETQVLDRLAALEHQMGWVL